MQISTFCSRCVTFTFLMFRILGWLWYFNIMFLGDGNVLKLHANSYYWDVNESLKLLSPFDKI